MSTTARRRTLLPVGLAFLAGALLTFIVAWICAALAPLGAPVTIDLRPGASTSVPREHAWWIDHAPVAADFPRSATLYTGPGVHQCGFTSPIPSSLPLSVIRTRAGWPLPCLEGSLWSHRGEARTGRRTAFVIDRRPQRLLPYRPLVPSFLGNALVYSALVLVVVRFGGSARARWRGRSGRCPRCGYPRGPGEACSECGHRISPPAGPE